MAYAPIPSPAREFAASRRLAALADALDPQTFAALAALRGPAPRLCLELGAGTGSVARRLAEQFPRARVVATDLAAPPARSPLGNLEFVRHDVRCDGFRDGTFDLIHVRYLLCDLVERDRILDDIASWLAPGGRLVVEEPDHSPVYDSPHRAYRTVTLAMVEAQHRYVGTDSLWARELPAHVAATGLTDIATHRTSTTVAAGSPMARYWRLSLAELRPLLPPGLDIPAALREADSATFRDHGFTTVRVSAVRRG
ncbi:class I SAM-dependent methyltransferase [Uniformispora flossi]|uniref:class I SAM-dependent methyltransferase n=1 Tax=Uniformispora flossi TaxID=3390723 RepID=UPI003C3007E2